MKAKRDWFFMDSKCLNSYLHRFEIVEESETSILEVCDICRMRKIFQLREGLINNNNYMSFHCRLALMKEHPLFEREYDYNPLNNEVESPYV